MKTFFNQAVTLHFILIFSLANNRLVSLCKVWSYSLKTSGSLSTTRPDTLTQSLSRLHFIHIKTSLEVFVPDDSGPVRCIMTLTNDPGETAAVHVEDELCQLHLQWIFSFMFQIDSYQHLNVKYKPTQNTHIYTHTQTQRKLHH